MLPYIDDKGYWIQPQGYRFKFFFLWASLAYLSLHDTDLSDPCEVRPYNASVPQGTTAPELATISRAIFYGFPEGSMHQAVGFASLACFYNTYIRCEQKRSVDGSYHENSGHHHNHCPEHIHPVTTINADQFLCFFIKDLSKLIVIMVLGGMGPGMIMDSADVLDPVWNEIIFVLLCCSVVYEFVQGTFEGSLHKAGFYKSLLYGLGHASDELSPALVRGFQIFLSEQIWPIAQIILFTIATGSWTWFILHEVDPEHAACCNHGPKRKFDNVGARALLPSLGMLSLPAAWVAAGVFNLGSVIYNAVEDLSVDTVITALATVCAGYFTVLLALKAIPAVFGVYCNYLKSCLPSFCSQKTSGVNESSRLMSGKQNSSGESDLESRGEGLVGNQTNQNISANGRSPIDFTKGGTFVFRCPNDNCGEEGCSANGPSLLVSKKS